MKKWSILIVASLWLSGGMANAQDFSSILAKPGQTDEHFGEIETAGLARQVAADGFDWSKDRSILKEIVHVLCSVAVTSQLTVDWVRASLITIADYYQWYVPTTHRWLLDACAQVGWWEYVQPETYQAH